MNIDKFGHHVHKRLRMSTVHDPINKGLLLNDAGQYDLKQQSRLIGLQKPLTPDEAVNKDYVDQNSKLFCNKHDIFDEIKSIKSQLQLLQKQLEEKCTRVDVQNIFKEHLLAIRDIDSRRYKISSAL